MTASRKNIKNQIDRLSKNDLKVIEHILERLNNDEVVNTKIIKRTNEFKKIIHSFLPKMRRKIKTKEEKFPSVELNSEKVFKIKETQIQDILSVHSPSYQEECQILSSMWENDCPKDREDKIKTNHHLTL